MKYVNTGNGKIVFGQTPTPTIVNLNGIVEITKEMAKDHAQAIEMMVVQGQLTQVQESQEPKEEKIEVESEEEARNRIKCLNKADQIDEIKRLRKSIGDKNDSIPKYEDERIELIINLEKRVKAK